MAAERHLHPLSLLVALPRLGPQLFGLIPVIAAISISGRWGVLALMLAIFAVVSLVTTFSSSN